MNELVEDNTNVLGNQSNWDSAQERSSQNNDELPAGWQQAFDPTVGIYYINHNDNTTQLEDPRLEVRRQQEQMLHEYLSHAAKDIESKEEIRRVKQQRLELAVEEMRHLDERLTNMKSSTTSLNSTVSSASTRYDPDLLRSEVMMAKERVMRLRGEMEQVECEVASKQRGLSTLAQVEQRMTGNTRHVYGVNEAQVILSKVNELRQSLHNGEHERRRLIERLLRLKNETQLYADSAVTSSPDVGHISLLPVDKLSTGSQTDGERLSRDSQRWGEICRMKLQYNEARKQVSDLQQQLASIEDRIRPEQIECDRDRLMVMQDKEQLLRELKSLNLSRKSESDRQAIIDQIRHLEYDLVQSMKASNENIERRLRLNEEKQEILQKLAQVTRLTTELELQLKSLSQSALSISSSSNQGSQESLFSSSSSLGMPEYYNSRSSYSQSDANLLNLHRRLQAMVLSPVSASLPAVNNFASPAASNEYSYSTDYVLPTQYVYPESYTVQNEDGQLAYYQPTELDYQQGIYTSDVQYYAVPGALPNTTYLVPAQNIGNSSSAQQQISPHHQSSPSSVSVGPPPTYQQHLDAQWHRNYAQQISASEPISIQYVTDGSYIQGAYLEEEMVAREEGPSHWPLSPITENSPAPGALLPQALFARSASASISNESVAGDSGVYEAGLDSRGSENDGLSPDIESAQVQIKLRYEYESYQLMITIEQARNLSALQLPQRCQVYIKTSLLPGGRNDSFVTHPSTNANNPRFAEVFALPIAEAKLVSQTLQVLVCCVLENGRDHCLGCAQVSLSAFNPKVASIQWYNILSFHFMQLDAGHSYQHQQSDENFAQVEAKNNQSTSKTSIGGAFAGDKITKLLEASSEKLKKCKKDKMLRPLSAGGESSKTLSAGRDSPSCGSHLDRGESSDDSTVISSQTSTLTRNQAGACDLDGANSEGSKEATLTRRPKNNLQRVIVDDDEEDEDDDDDSDSDENDDLPGDATVRLVTHDKQTNTDNNGAAKAGTVTGAGNVRNVRRAKTFSPVDKKAPTDQLICKLNRSGSDTSVKCRHNNFLRSARERQSHRYKQLPQCVSRCQSLSTLTSSCVTKRTSLELELDLQAAKLRHGEQQKELCMLRTLVDCFEAAKEAGEAVLSDLLNSEQFQIQLTAVLRTAAEVESRGSLSLVDEKAAKLLRRIQHEVHRLRRSRSREPEVETFREKMAFFTKAHGNALLSDTEKSSAISSNRIDLMCVSKNNVVSSNNGIVISTDGSSISACGKMSTTFCNKTDLQSPSVSSEQLKSDCSTSCLSSEQNKSSDSSGELLMPKLHKLSVHTREPLEV